MKIQRLRISGFKRYRNSVNFDFSGAKDINTISGKNGSGKTTIADAILIIQAVAFLYELKRLYPEQKFTKQVEKDIDERFLEYVNGKRCTLQLDLIEGNTDINIQLTYNRFSETPLEFEIRNGEDILRSHWNLVKPDDLIVYISSVKHYDETNYRMQDLSIQTRYSLPVERDIWLLLNIVIYPNSIFNLLYKNLIDDWAYDRLIPSKGKRDLYFKLTQDEIHGIFPYIKFNNFSANNYKPDEVVYLVSNTETNGKRFDIRNLSTGEKTVFYEFLFINLAQRISLLIIDEPENHLHENALLHLVKSLCLLANEEYQYIDVLRNLGVQQIYIDNFLEFYGNNTRNKIDQVFMFTHSKMLIRYVYTIGMNFVISQNLSVLNYEDAEKKLREIGINSIYSKTVFVEGRTDLDLLAPIIEKGYDIKPIGNCDELIRIYSSLKKVSNYVTDFKYVFIMDSDTRSNPNVEAIMSKSPDDFIVLERHEIENYLIDIEVWYEAAMHLADDKTRGTLTVGSINQLLHDAAVKQMVYFKKLYLEQKLRYLILDINATIKHKEIPVEEREYNLYVNQILDKVKIDSFITSAQDVFKQCGNLYSAEEVEKNWISICPGKQVCNIAANSIAQIIGVAADRYLTEIKKVSRINLNSPIQHLVDEICQRIEN